MKLALCFVALIIVSAVGVFFASLFLKAAEKGGEDSLGMSMVGGIILLVIAYAWLVILTTAFLPMER